MVTSTALIIFACYWAIAILCWGYALVFGHRPARLAFLLFVLAMVATSISTELVHRDNPANAWSAINPPLLAADAVYFVGLFALTVRYRRYWLVWSSGLQLACTLTHFGPLIDPDTNANLYRGLESMWMLPMLLTMVAGIRKDRAATTKPIVD